MTSTLLVLSRHGQTVWHEENRYAGVSDVDLTDVGRDQAQALARWAGQERPDVVVSSPVRRALETARPVAAALGLTPEIYPGLREVSFGIAEGRTIAEMRAADPAMVDRFRSDPVVHHFPEGENPSQAADRAADTLHLVAQKHPGATVLVVAHNTLLRLGLCRLLDLDVSRYRTVFPRLDNGTLTRLALQVDGARSASLLSFNAPLPAPDRTASPTTPPAASPTTQGDLR